MDMQEYYESAVEYIANQETRCVTAGMTFDEGECVYQNDGGNHCVIGRLIPKGHDGLTYLGGVESLVETFDDLREIVLPSGPKGMALAKQLQQLHDIAKYRDRNEGTLSRRGRIFATQIADQFELEPVAF